MVASPWVQWCIPDNHLAVIILTGHLLMSVTVISPKRAFASGHGACQHFRKDSDSTRLLSGVDRGMGGRKEGDRCACRHVRYARTVTCMLTHRSKNALNKHAWAQSDVHFLSYSLTCTQTHVSNRCLPISTTAADDCDTFIHQHCRYRCHYFAFPVSLNDTN